MYNSHFELGHVALNVRDLATPKPVLPTSLWGWKSSPKALNRLTLALKKTPWSAWFRQSRKTKSTTATDSTTWPLSYLAAKTLVTILRHFIDNKIPLQGASDHGYSEAIYLADTEGNGVEIYRDLPQDTWDVRPHGRIVGITEPMDAETIYALGKKSWRSLSNASWQSHGHVHLSVRESAASAGFTM